MTLPVPSFAALAAGNQNLSLFDQQFNALAAQGVIACTASGANAVILTPMTNYFVPSGYTDTAPVFTWKQAQGSTAAVTINVANLGAVNAYKNNGQTAVGNGDLVAGAVYTAAYLGALNGGAGGFVVDVVPTALSAAGPVQAAFKNLVVSVTSNTQVNVTADAITLFDGTNYSTGASVNVTAATGTSGVNGLDTGTVANATFYSVWVIQNTASGALAALISTSATAPTMPTGYAKKARVGWVTTASGATNLLKTLQNGRRSQYVVTGGAPNATLPNMGNGVAGTYSATTPMWAALAVSAFVPSTAGEIILVLASVWEAGATSNIIVAPNNSYGGSNHASGNIPPLGLVLVGSGGNQLLQGSVVLESTNIYWASSAAGGAVSCLGWIDNI